MQRHGSARAFSALSTHAVTASRAASASASAASAESARFYSARKSIALKAAAAATAEAVDAEVVEELPTNENDNELLKLRHSSAHVMAMAVQEVFPEAQVTIGPWIENGFYYDFYFPETTDPETGETVPSRKLTDQDLKQVKKRMDKIIGKNYPIEHEEVTREEAKRRIEEIGEPFKLEILDSIKTEPITIYKIGEEWWDLCAGPHVESTGKIPKKACPAPERGRCLLARRRESRDAPAHLRHGVEGPPAAQAVQEDDGGSQEARSSCFGQEARSVLHSGGLIYCVIMLRCIVHCMCFGAHVCDA